MSNRVPEIRIRRGNERRPRADGEFVLYWMIAFRRVRHNFSLQHAVEWCEKLNKPLVILEALRSDYPWASDRLHRFVLEGMAANRDAVRRFPARHFAYVEPARGHGAGLLSALAQRACLVVTDEFPCFFLPRMVAAAAKRLEVPLVAVDSNGLLPLRATGRVFARAYDFRRFLQAELPPHLNHPPHASPLANRRLPVLESLPREIIDRWPPASERLLAVEPAALAALPIDHGVAPADMAGGMDAAERTARRFLDRRLARYAELRSHPDEDAASGLSPYLHFGHISPHDVFARIARREEWAPGELGGGRRGAKQGWWGMSPESEAFLDELVTWRELGYNVCAHTDDFDRYDSLPDWARQTLADHAGDCREPSYSLEQFESAATQDRVWNAAQTQLVREGRLHNYMRMLWGKKILHWSESPQEALRIMIHLNNKYGVDGRNPNSYSGISWVLGRYDRPWGPERPIFGKVRFMSSGNTLKKLRARKYLARYESPAHS